MAGTDLDKEVSGNDSDLFYLKWHNFQKNVSKQFEKLREDDDLVDITFACDGKEIRAHKLVLFACSPYFKQLLKVGYVPISSHRRQYCKITVENNTVPRLL